LKKLVIYCLIAVLLFSAFNQQSVLGHDPAEIRLGYYYADQILEVWIYHPIYYPEKHWVNNVQVRKNNVLVGNYSYDSQPGDIFTYNYSIIAVHFDMIKVRVFCTYQGDTEAEIMVLDPDNPTTVPPTPSKLFEIPLVEFMIVISFIVTIFSRFRKTGK